jgi:hypothetical protein
MAKQMDPRLIAMSATLIVSGSSFLYKGFSLSPAQIEETILSPWTKEIVVASGACLVGLGIYLLKNSQ